jgi:hypothetical protein
MDPLLFIKRFYPNFKNPFNLIVFLLKYTIIALPRYFEQNGEADNFHNIKNYLNF